MENRIGFGKRLGALLIDAVLVCIVSLLVVSLLVGPTIGGMLGAAASGAIFDALALTMLVGAVHMMLVGAVYFLVEGFTGWTLGKLILGIQVANADGTRAGVGTLLTRYALKNINFLLGVLAFFTGVALFRTLRGLLGLVIFVGCFFVLGSARQGFHDMIAKTAVYPRKQVRTA
jgi:uncharacterized RDD family membrane protein YckC